METKTMDPIISPVTKSLSDISMIMSDGYKFLLLRAACERWEKEAVAGNQDSATLIEIISHFERLIKVVTEKNTPTL